MSSQAVRDQCWWSKLDFSGRPTHQPASSITLHSDSSDIGWSGTLSLDSVLPPGTPGDFEYQGLSSPLEVRLTILWRELYGLFIVARKAADLVDSLGHPPTEQTTILCYQDN